MLWIWACVQAMPKLVLKPADRRNPSNLAREMIGVMRPRQDMWGGVHIHAPHLHFILGTPAPKLPSEP